jgi:spore photoproduct lyase
LKSFANDYYSPFFSHIYVEEAVKGHRRTKRILERFSNATVIEIAHYKDVFCRKGQDAIRQGNSQKLVLAAKRGTLIYPGAAVCHDFGNKHFYYTSCMMNCIYGCEYCYLKGMYPSGNIVLFVNLEDYFEETERMLSNHPVYLCVSYDTDLLALEPVAGYVAEWVRFAQGKQDFHMEVRTKCADRTFFGRADPTSFVVYAFTLSPQAVIGAYEHGTPSLAQRIACAKEAAQKGFAVRLCFDPMIYIPGWKEEYAAMVDQVFGQIPAESVKDASIGSFRVPQDYLKKMRRQEPGSAVAQFPYQNIGGVYQYPKALSGKMEGFLAERLNKWLPGRKVFFWGDFSQRDV